MIQKKKDLIRLLYKLKFNDEFNEGSGIIHFSFLSDKYIDYNKRKAVHVEVGVNEEINSIDFINVPKYENKYLFYFDEDIDIIINYILDIFKTELRQMKISNLLSNES